MLNALLLQLLLAGGVSDGGYVGAVEVVGALNLILQVADGER